MQKYDKLETPEGKEDKTEASQGIIRTDKTKVENPGQVISSWDSNPIQLCKCLTGADG